MIERVRLELTPEELNMTPEELSKLRAEIDEQRRALIATDVAIQYIKELLSKFEI